MFKVRVDQVSGKVIEVSFILPLPPIQARSFDQVQTWTSCRREGRA